MGGTVNLSVTATGTAPLSFQWLKNGGMVLGATNSALSLTNAGVASSGVYCVVVTNAYGLSISQPVTVTVGTPQLLAWGDNQYGQLGDGTTINRSNAVSVASNVVTAAAGYGHSLFLKSDGTLWAMGDNGGGQLGDGTDTDKYWPESVASNVVAVAAGTGHSLFVKSDGTLWAMGDNNYGQLGDGTTINRSLPESVASNVVAVAAGQNHSIFLKSDGTMWTMGYNYDGELGNGTTTDRNSPVAVLGGSNVVAVAAGWYNSLFLKGDGSLWAMGDNEFGQLGDGTTTQRNSPVSVPGLSLATVVSGCAAYHTLAVGLMLPPVITTQPTNQTVVVGGNVTFTVTASGFGPLAYQWQFNDTNLMNATNSSYTLASAALGDAGGYAVVVTNTYGSTLSTTAILTVAVAVTVTVAANPTDAGSVAGGGLYFAGSNAVLTATATNGWAFASWSDGSTLNPYAIVVETNLTLTAEFAPAVTVTITADPTNAGSVTGGGVLIIGSNTVLTETASNNWQFINWNDGATNNPYTITVPETNVTYTATFAATATITVNASPSSGGSVTGGGTYLVGSTNLLTATATNGWIFTGWNDGTTSGSYSVVSTSNQVFIANFAPAATVTILINPTNAGAVVAGGGVYPIGSSATLTASILTLSNQNQWVFLNWNGTVENYTRTGNHNYPLGFTVTTNITVTANFAQVTSDGFVYTYIGGIEIVGYEGDATSLIIPSQINGVPVNEIGPEALTGEKFDYVGFDDGVSDMTLDGTCIDAGELDFANIADFDGLLEAGAFVIEGGALEEGGQVLLAAGLTVGALDILAGIFSDLSIVQANVDSAGGGHTTGSGMYFAGTPVLVTASANSGWRFNGWSDGSIANKHWVTSPYTVTANFIQQSTVTVLANPAEDAGTVTGSGTYDVGTLVTITATAEEGWEFSDWSDEYTNSQHTISVPDHDVTYTANFEVEVEGEAEPPTGGFILGNGSYPQGTWVPLLATNYVGWRFTGWFLEADSTNSTWLTNITTVIVAANPLTPPLKYKAHFEQLVMVTGLANPTNAGSVDGSGTYDVDDTNITLTATASNNWVFVKWNDGTTNNPYTVTVPPILVLEDIFTNIICTATFAATAAITVEADPTNGGAVSGGGTFLVGSTNLITAAASNGWAFTGWSDGSTTNLHSIVVTSNQTYTAGFAQISIVTGLANPTNAGIVTGGGIYFVGSNAVLTATASNAWRFIEWNDGTTNNPYSITVPDTNATYTASFAATAVITVGANPTNGGSVTGGGTFMVGSTNLITASASNGWLFAGWNDGTTADHYNLIVPATNSTFTAEFTAGNSTNITTSVSGNSLTLAWPADHLGWILQALTNGLSSTNWFDLPGTGDTNSLVIPMDPANAAVFYRLRQP